MSNQTDPIKVQLTVNIDPQLIRDLVITAVEGGINYWCEEVALMLPQDDSSRPFQARSFTQMADSGFPGVGYIILIAKEPPRSEATNREFHLMLAPGNIGTARDILRGANIAYGLQVMAEKYPRHFGNLMGDAWDAETADVFIQCCIFGEIIYG